MIWNPSHECQLRAELEAIQSERLVRLVARVYEGVPFYRRRLDEAGVRPGDIRGIGDLARLPFTRKSDLRDNYPLGLLAVPREQVIRIHASTGTTGKPTIVAYARNDLDVWSEVCARCLTLAGARPGQVFQNAYGYGLFTGGLGLHQGAERLGMTVIPASTGNTARQLLLMEDLGAEVLACTPSYALTLAEALAERGIGPERLRLRTLLLGAEPWTDAMRSEIESSLRADALNIYGLSEVIGPGVANECVEGKDGSHVCEDHFLLEVVDPQSGQPVPDGETGELVFTTLTKEAMPLLRYRTGDLASVSREPCRCGRTSARISRIIGRTDDMLIIRGVNVFPSQVEAALAGLEGIAVHHRIVLTRDGHLDQLDVEVELAGPLVAESEMAGLAATLRRRLHETVGLSAGVRLLPPGSLPRSDGGKTGRVLDQRNA